MPVRIIRRRSLIEALSRWFVTQVRRKISLTFEITRKTFLFFLSQAAERPRPAPRICPCENGGICREDTNGDLLCDCLTEFSGNNCEKYLGGSFLNPSSNVAAIVVPIVIILLVMTAAAGVWYAIRKKPFGKMARLTSLASSQSVSFRHGNNVEFNSPGFPNNGPPPPENPPIDGFNLEAVSSKSRDFSNPMYDAVQSGTTADPSIESGSGE